MELTNKILDTALLSELAYLNLENEYFKNKTYSFDFINNFLKENDNKTTGIDDNRVQPILDILKEYTIVDFKNIPTSFVKIRGQYTN